MVLPATPSESRAAGIRAYAMLGGGALLGVTLAVGLTGWVLSSRTAPPELSPSVASQTTKSASADTGNESQRPETAIPEPAEPGRDAGGFESREPQPEITDRNRVTPATATGPDMESPDEIASAVDTPPDDIQESVDEVTQRIPTEPSEAHDVAEEPTPPPPPQVVDTPVPASGDGLAAFAQWLQDSDAALLPAGPPIPDASPPDPSESTTAEQEGDVALDDDTAVLQPTRSPPPRVDVEARLDEPISALQLKKVPLLDSLRLVTQLSTIPIRLDPDALGRFNIRADVPVDVTVRKETVRGLLNAIVGQAGLAWVADQGFVMVTTEADSRGEWVTHRHDVSDLTQDDPAATSTLAKWVTQLIEYGTWTGQSDTENAARCEAEGAFLVVTHRDTVHYQVLEFCEKLRVAHGLKPRTRILRDRIAMGTRSESCAGLDQSVSLRLWQDRSIDEISAALEQQVALRLLVDWPALYHAGWSPQDLEKFFCDRQTLRDVLSQWLHPKGLTYRVIDARTLEITTPQALAEDHDVEFYRLGSDSDGDVDVRGLGQKILLRLGEATFQPQGTGAVTYDQSSRTLIVSLPQPKQRIVAQILAE